MALNRAHQAIGLILLFLTGVFADFGIMTADVKLSSGHTAKNYAFIPNPNDPPLTCEDIWFYPKYPERDDVSGDKQGVRYDGQRPDDPQQIEFNTGFGHYSMYPLWIAENWYSQVLLLTKPIAIYKNRDYHIFSLDDKDTGGCKLDNTFVRDCAKGSNEHWTFRSIVSCVSEDINIG